MKKYFLQIIEFILLGIFLGCSDPSKHNFDKILASKNEGENETSQCLSLEQKNNIQGKSLKELILKISELNLNDACLNTLKINHNESSWNIE